MTNDRVDFQVTQADMQEILQLFEDGDRALMAANGAEMRRIYADDYTQSDESGRISSRQEIVDRLTSGQIRFISMKSTGRDIRLLRDDVAVVHGSEEDEVELEGRRCTARYIYTDVVVKRNGRWQIVASQLARPS
jgi:uncharacterized protein (TIGR02246 family)